MNNILITGGTGFIGSHLAQHLAKDKNNQIFVLAHSIKRESVFNALKLNEVQNINVVLGDINVYSNIEEILYQYDIDRLYHLAAKVIVKDASKSPLSTFETNIFGTINVLEAVRLLKKQTDEDIPILINSTDKTYGVSDLLPYKEDYPLNGLDVYSASKASADILARSYAYNYGLPIVISRPSNVFGLDFNWSRIIPSLAISCLLEKDKDIILNKGSYNFIREYTYVKDTVRALELLLKNIDITKGNAYNISSGHKYTTEEVVETFLDLFNCKNKQLKFKEKESTFKEIPDQYLDSSKLKLVTQWKPEYNLKIGLRETIENYKKWFNSNTNK